MHFDGSGFKAELNILRPSIIGLGDGSKASLPESAEGFRNKFVDNRATKERGTKKV
jgi:hypothetical protein